MTIYKVTYKPSRQTMTRPNQALSVKQILERFTRGQALPIGYTSYDDPQNLSEDEQMSLHECEDDFERMNILNAIEEGDFDTSRQSSDSETKRSAVKSSERRREAKNDPPEDVSNNSNEE